MTLRRIVPLAALLGLAGTVATFLVRRRRAAGAGTADTANRDYEVRDGVIDLTGVATEDQVPDVIKGVADVPSDATT